MSLLSFHQVSFRYHSSDDRPVIGEISLHLREGEFCALLGRSGCGKSTLLKLAAGLLQPSEGHVSLAGNAVRAGADIGIVFQSPVLLEWLTVLDNVLLPIRVHRRPTAEERGYARTLLAQVGLGARADSYPGQLSGGQQSRVSLARALITSPRLLLLDEPFAALDALTREELQEQLAELVAERGMTALFVTHDISEALFLADRVLILHEGGIARELIVHSKRSARVRFGDEQLELMAEARVLLAGGGGA
ncbi:ABC transporter ATP-binding protein [Paenibacillus sp. 1P07SE]|uniref:ABC transporter ATP-binding protein n=1 Tax=Paenibacillus sp. 1P07SE TaxID=3132209 RepID=UPI0039A6D61A